MALGRIKRNRGKVLRTGNRLVNSRAESKNLKIDVTVSRLRYGSEASQRRKYSADSLYGASACVGKANDARYNARRDYTRTHKRCGYSTGRTPQSAIGKAVVQLGKNLAKRGRRKPYGSGVD